MLTVFSDRIEILSKGTIPPRQTMEGFYAGDKVGDKNFKLNPTCQRILQEMRNNPKLTRGIAIELLLNAINHRLCKALHNACYAKLFIMQSHLWIAHKYRQSRDFCFT